MQELQEIGLSNTESKIYIALLELGSALAGEITKKSGVNRTNVYDALERLIEKGLVSFIISANRKLFKPVNPKRLKEILEEKQEQLDKLLPALNSKFHESKESEDASIFKGKKGIKSIMEDVLNTKKDLYAYGAQSRFTEEFPFYQKHWHDKRTKLKINIKIIYNEKVKSLKEKAGYKLMIMKFLPENYDFPSTTLIYGENVVTLVWTETPYAFIIKSKEVAKSNMNFFDLLWKIAKN